MLNWRFSEDNRAEVKVFCDRGVAEAAVYRDQAAMTKIGRNAPCPCGSRTKYKKCCGNPVRPQAAGNAPPPEVMARIQLEVQRQGANEHRRRLMQGLGRPIISFESHGYRLVAVGSKIRWSKSWLTFADFLFDYIKAVLTPAWGQAELAKPAAEQHPIMDWLRRIDAHRKANAHTKQGKIYTAPITGVVRAYLGLAYDLYLSAHNAELPALLLKRLRNAKTFEGALYEAFVIGSFAKAGFTIEFEDEGDSSSTHCEFTATHKVTKKKFSVEAKAISSLSTRAGNSGNQPRIRNLLYGALRKQAPHDRIVFIELNRMQTIMPNGEPDWMPAIDHDLAQAEAELTIEGHPAPPAYLFITNRPFMNALDAPAVGELGVGHGFKIQEFPQGRGCKSMLEAVEARERHLEAHWLLKAMQSHAQIPSTFDGRLPEEAFATDQPVPLRIGDTHLVPDETGREVPGVLCEGTVIEGERKAWCVYRLVDGRSVIVTVPLSDNELAIYRRSPETFFGVVKHVGKGIKQPMDAYDFLFESYSQSTKEKLLEFMAGWPDIEAMRELDQPELAKRYCARMAEEMWAQFMASKDAGKAA